MLNWPKPSNSKIVKPVLLLLASSLVLACTNTPKPPIESFECLSPRSQICTMDYRPVCATRKTNIQCVTTPCPTSELHSYANACGACADVAVSDYTEGACKVEN